ncbi:MAG: PqqD family protein [Phycisphaeraceae bacterium]|nr:PqqD family protein [Phycisphaeraceae bacterium]MDP7347721.1 PqqD family protein [Phycisphaeraceae bacterium]
MMRRDARKSRAGATGRTWRPMLRTVPAHNQAAHASDTQPGQSRIVVPRRRPNWLVPPVSWIIRPRPTRDVQLDRLGTRVWRLCNGHRTVENIIDAFAGEHRLTFHEARIAVTGHISDLARCGALVLVMHEQVDSDESSTSPT